MQYIKKGNTQPADWEVWFTKATGERSYDYDKDRGAMRDLLKAREFLIKEQNGLCAYCQKKIDLHTSSIEHVFPKTSSKVLSTNYHNLVASCTQPPGIDAREIHCDPKKEHHMIVPIMLSIDSECKEIGGIFQVNKYFRASADGSISTKSGKTDGIDQVFIEVLNLNSEALKRKREKYLDGIIAVLDPGLSPVQKRIILINKIRILLLHLSHEYREYLLIYCIYKVRSLDQKIKALK